MSRIAENPNPHRYLLTLYVLVYVSVIATVAASAYLRGQEQLLRRLTVESGPYEIASVLVALALALYVAYQLLFTALPARLSAIHLGLLVLIGLAAFLTAGEEMSWGQHLFDFSSPRVFVEHNYQRETNLHNFIYAPYQAGFINTFIYVCFIYGPCVYRLLPSVLENFPRIDGILQPLLPSFHVTLMMSFSASLHPYFLPTSLTDTLAHVGGIVLILLLIWRQPELRSRVYILHCCAVVAATGFFMLNSQVFGFYNLQAEIREFVVILVGTIWLVEWTQRERAAPA